MDKGPSIQITGGTEAFTLLLSRPIGATASTLIVIKTPLQQLPVLSCPALTPVQVHHLAESLVAIAGIPDYTPTAFDQPTPLRLDAMFQHLLNQPPAFLHSLLRNWCEWFGLQPTPAINQAWTSFVAACATDPIDLPDVLSKLVERGLACTDAEYLYVPLPVAVALANDTQMPGWDALATLLHHLRHSLLRNRSTGMARQAYRQITAFLRTPHPSLDGHTYRVTRGRGTLVNLACHDWSAGISPPILDAVLVALQSLYQSNADRYQAVFNRVHGPVWDTVGQGMDKLAEIEFHTPAEPISIDPTSYANSCRLVSQRLQSVAEAYAVLTELETTLGADRYLGSRALGDDLSVIHGAVRRIGQRTHQSLNVGRQLYLRQWNLTSIASIILRLLDLPGGSGPLTDYFPNNRQRVIFLLIDALGYTQFQWFLNTVSRRAAAPLASNIFAWLREQRAYDDSYLLASNLVSVTGACLPTIYTGALPRQTGIIGSRMVVEGHELNVLRGTDERHRLKDHEVADVYQRNVNRTLTPFAQVAYQSGVDVSALHGGSMGFGPLADFTYGSLRQAGRVRRVSPADRIFAEALPTIVAWADTPEEKHLALLYYPLIDHSGHGCGPYTQFQTAELSKLNFVLTHFLVDLVYQAGELFDNRTSVVITADHGMFESATTAVSHRMVRRALGGEAACRGMTFVYDNRAMYIYGIEEVNLEPTRQKLAGYFSENGLPIAVVTRNDSLVADLLCDPSSPWAVNCPDLILQFYGPGVFYYKDDLPSHMFFYGAHGGISVEETFVPLIHFTLSPDLAVGLKRFF